MLAVVDHLVANVPVPAGTTRDDAGAWPSPFEPAMLYGWAVTEARGTDHPEVERSDFTVRLAITTHADEGPGAIRDRAVSEALDGAVRAIADWVMANRVGPALDDGTHLWGFLRVARIDWDAIRGSSYRGTTIDLTGWRFVAAAEEEAP